MEAKLVAELDRAGLLVTKECPNPRPMQHNDLSALPYLSWVCKARCHCTGHRWQPVTMPSLDVVTKCQMSEQITCMPMPH